MTGIRITVSPGELLDRITILEVRVARTSGASWRMATKELGALNLLWDRRPSSAALIQLRSELLRTNEAIWDAEDVIRLCMRAGAYEGLFTKAAREAHEKNDERARLKAEINLLLGAPAEEKSYGGDQ